MWPEWTSMLSWWQWSLLALVPPAIIALYFLKLKRQPLVVPSTFLWQRAIEDLHVNSLWQRLRRSLLLWLQLLLVALVILALFGPSWRGSQLVGDRFIFLIDRSASMSASDVSPSRLEAAKRQVSALVDQMKPNDQAMVISFADSPQVEQPFTDNRDRLIAAIESIRPTERSTSLAEALRLAAGLAWPAESEPATDDEQAPQGPPPARIYIYSDGKFADVPDAALANAAPTFVAVGEGDAHNLAIGAFRVNRPEDRPEQLQAFARLENYSDQPANASVGLYLDGELIDANQVDISPGGEGGLEFNISELDTATLELRVDAEDQLAVDNRAWAALNPARRARVLCLTEGDEPLELALGTERAVELADVDIQAPAFLASDEYRRRAAGGGCDLVIYDRCAPAEMPMANTLFIGRVPPAAGWSAGEKVDVPQLIDLERTHPLMQFVEMGDVLFREGTPLNAPPGGTELVDSDRGTIAAIAPREAYEDVVLGFELVGGEQIGTNWPLRPSFPVFVLNAIEYLGGGAATNANLENVRPGDVVSLRIEGTAERATVVSPSGRPASVSRGRRNTFDFADTGELGMYEVYVGDDRVERFAVNLFDPQESDIRPRRDGTIHIGQTQIAGTSGPQPVRQHAWRALLLAALAVLLVEWYIYNRRVYL